MKPPIAVALITNELGEIFVGQRCDADHAQQEIELLGGKIEAREQPDHTIEREVWEEANSRVRTLGLVTRLEFDDDGEMRKAEVWNAEFLVGQELYAKEPGVHGSVGYISIDELQRCDNLSPVLRTVRDMILSRTLERTTSISGQQTWH